MLHFFTKRMIMGSLMKNQIQLNCKLISLLYRGTLNQDQLSLVYRVLLSKSFTFFEGVPHFYFHLSEEMGGGKEESRQTKLSPSSSSAMPFVRRSKSRVERRLLCPICPMPRGKLSFWHSHCCSLWIRNWSSRRRTRLEWARVCTRRLENFTKKYR